MPSNGNSQRGKQAALSPALREFQGEWQAVQAAVRAAGNGSSAESAAGRSAPSADTVALWEQVVDVASRLLAGALHFADGGDYDATGVTAGSAEAPPAPEQAADTEPAPEQPAAGAAASESQELADFTRAVRGQVPDATDADCASALELFHDAHTVKNTPLQFVQYPGFTGAAAYEWLCSQFGAMPKISPVPQSSDVTWHAQVWEITQSSQLTRTFSFVNADVAPQLGEHVTEVDVIAQYLAAARSVELPHGDPVELTQIPDDFAADWLKAEHPGYVQLGSDPELAGLPITVRGPFGGLQAGSLLPMPAARYLHRDHKVDLDIDWALVWPKKTHGRHLGRWAQLFADAREALEAAVDRGEPGAEYALMVNKMIYAAFLGGMLRSEHNNALGTLRPDWWDQLVTQGGVNQLRALDKGLRQDSVPLGAMKDSVWFVADHGPHRPAGLDFHSQPGKWTADRWGEVTQELIEAHQRGRPALVRDAVIATNKAREEAAA